MRQVAILGSGPAGLLAALAAKQTGNEPIIFSKKIKSPMFGAMYLHEAIPGLTNPEPDFELDVIKVGSQEGYAYNVYGDREAPCSWEHIPSGSTPAWNLHRAYDRLWKLFEPVIRPAELDHGNVGIIANNFPITMSTIPAPAICGRNHEFTSQEIEIIHGPGNALIKGVNDDHMMYYCGVPWDGSFDVGLDDPNWQFNNDENAGNVDKHLIGHDWYRFSQIHQHQAWEYPKGRGIKHFGADEISWGRKIVHGKKPLTTNCTCWLAYPGYRRLGRFGKWQKAVLTHHAYREALEICREV